VITFRFFVYMNDIPVVLECPDGTPVRREGETIKLPNGLLYDVNGVAYEFNANGSAPDVIVRIDHF
jgi:hypothetical protein